MIHIVGLGPGNEGALTLGAIEIMDKFPLYLRTKKHPTVDYLEKRGVSYSSFDSFYEKAETFDQVYEEIKEEIIKESEKGDVIYAVPGHPLVAEKSVMLLLDVIKKENIDYKIYPSVSFVDTMLEALLIDPIKGIRIVDALDIEKETPDFSKGTIITQVFSPYIAGRVKLALLNYLDDEDPIVFVRAAGTRDEVVRPLKLYELDRQKDIDDLTSIYVPPMEGKYDFYTFMRVVEQLRDKDEGCPWDKEQTHASLKKYLIEESYEVLEAIDLEDYESLQEELGDVLLQILLHSTIGKEKGEFNVHEVIRTVAEKMVYRHPHVFKKEEVMTSGEVKDQWEELKKKEKKEASLGQALEKISKFNPSLTRAEKIQGKARKYGFDWQDIDDVFSKLFEEIQEVKDAISDKSQIEVERELGDLLFSVVNLSRFLKVDPEITLNETSDRFVNRIQLMEAEISKAGLDFQALSLENLDKYWENAKKNEK